jgi:hypothetical protein
MNNAKGNPPRIAPPIGAGSRKSEETESRSGRPAFDDRGNAVWEWQTEEGDFSRDNSTQRLKKLDLSKLSLEDTQRLKQAARGSPKEGALPGGGFNPYERGTCANETGQANQKPVGQSIQSKYAASARKPVKDLKRLQEWMALKQRLANKKDDD